MKTALAAGLVLAAAAAASPPARAQGAAETLTFVEDPWPPFTLGKEGPPEGGIAVDVIRALFEIVGQPVELELLPWTRVLAMAKAGQVDGVMLLAPSPERAAFLEFTQPIMTAQNGFFHRRDRTPPFTWARYQDLSGLQIGAVKGFNYGDAFAAAVQAGQLAVEYSSSEAPLLHKLVMGRLDLVVSSAEVGVYTLKRDPALRGKVVFAAPPVSTVDLHIGLARGGRAMALLPRINQAIQTIKAEGTLAWIQQRYLND